MKKIIAILTTISLSLAPLSTRAEGDMAGNLIGVGVQLAVGVGVHVVLTKTMASQCNGPWTAYFCAMAGVAAMQATSYIMQGRDTLASENQARCEAGSAFCDTDSGAGTGIDGQYGGPGTMGAGGAQAGFENGGVFGKGGPLSAANLAKAEKTVNAAKQKLADMGYKLDPVTGAVTTPGGKSVTGADLAGSGAGGLGATKEQIAEAQALIKSISDAELKKVLASVEESGGGSGGSGGKAAAGSADPGAPDFSKLLGGDRKPAAEGVQGLQKYLGGEPIGVAGDNIFEMVSRRYTAERKKGDFIAPATAGRVPASTTPAVK